MEVISSIYNSGYNIKKFYLGSRELNLAYLGNQVIYDEVIGDNDLNYILYEFYGSDTLPNTVEAPVKSATLKGSTKYRDIDTGDILDTFDETKNLELVSVKVPVLTTTGKNLINENTWNNVVTEDNNECLVGGGWATTGGPVGQPIIIPVAIKSGHTYTVSCTNKATSHYNRFFIVDDMIGNSVATVRTYIGENSTKGTFTTSELTFIADRDYKYLMIDTGEPSAMGYIVKNTLQVEVGNTHTPYEPYKSNILTVNEEVELRGIGNVQDELNLLTGEVTQRVGYTEHLLQDLFNFSTGFGRGIHYDESSDRWYGRHNGINHSYFKNMLPLNFSITNDVNSNVSIYKVNTDWFAFSVKSSELISKGYEATADGLSNYAKNEKMICDYNLLNEVIKTVDLTIVDQDGKTISILNSFNGATHVSTEVAENSAYPMVAIEVASELQTSMSEVAEDIELIKPVQNDIETTVDTQSNDIDSLLLATTELFEMFL